MPLKDGKATFRVVFLRNGKEGHVWEGAEPNFLIWEHLNKRAEAIRAAWLALYPSVSDKTCVCDE
jgi:hypothetical protein